MEDFFSELGFGWTASKVFPYIVFLIVGLVLVLVIRKLTKKRKLRMAAWLLAVIPCVVYFLVNPIYEGDFANGYSSQKQNVEISEEGHLTVIAIPNCPFCHEALERLLKIQKRTSSVKIDFKVLTSDSLALGPYLDKADGLINVVKEGNFAPFEKIAGSRFPVFVYTSSKESRVWNNDQIGTIAFDWLEHQLKRK